jgi:membrane protease YdiL (CAAX protease family)
MSEGKDNAVARQEGQGVGKLRGLVLVQLAVQAPILLAVLVGWQLWVMPLARTAAPEWQLASRVVLAIGFCALMLGLYGLMSRHLESRRPTELAWRGAGPHLLRGVATGALLFTTLYTLLTIIGFARVEWAGALERAAIALLAAAMAAVGEELLFRGVLFRLAETAFGTAVALVLSAVLFGVMHAYAPGATLLSMTVIALEAGLLLGAAFAASRTLWFPIGLHAGWNFTEGGIFGIAVSGTPSHGLLSVTLSGPDLWTGGGFGPEASAVTVLLCLMLAGFFCRRARCTGLWRPMHLRLRLEHEHVND